MPFLDVALVTYEGRPDLTEDDRLLLVELRRRGVRAAGVVWSAPEVDWAGVRLAVLRETWDYHLRLGEFLAWLDRASQVTTLLNPPKVVRWNAHKGYLRDLEARGVAIVPTVWLDRGQAASFQSLIERTGWSEVVIKPVVSASSFETMLFRAEQVEPGQAHLDRLLGACDLMAQPFLRSVQAYGERSLMFVDGEFTHAARRPEPFMADGAVYESRPAQATVEEVAFARQVLAAAPFSEACLYARVDLAHDDSGRLVLMELELIEPSLFLHYSPQAVSKLAGSIERHLSSV